MADKTKPVKEREGVTITQDNVIYKGKPAPKGTVLKGLKPAIEQHLRNEGVAE